MDRSHTRRNADVRLRHHHIVLSRIAWDDLGHAKGDASGNLSPALTTTERLVRSIPALFRFGPMLIASIWWRRRKRKA